MATKTPPRVLLVTRPSEYELLIARHATRGQAAFFLETRGQRIEDVERRHAAQMEASDAVSRAIPSSWRRARVERADLDRFLFEPDDIVLAVGQDGLVANVAKYLAGQPVIGINPEPEWNDGVLARHPASRVKALLEAAAEHAMTLEARTMVEAATDDGQHLLALNEVFVGHRSHQSARYRLRFHDEEERQSSSGLIVTSGTGATGWARSISRQRRSKITLPEPTDGRLAFLVREAFPSVSTGTSLTAGVIAERDALELVSELGSGGVIFGDGIEDDHIELGWGMRVRIGAAKTRLSLVVAAG